MIVADASIAITLLTGSRRASRAWRRVERERRLHTPHVFDLEVVNALRRLVRAGAFPPDRARVAIARIDSQLRVQRHDHAPLLDRVWTLRENLTAYDASYVALAEQLHAILLTEDRGMAEAPGIRCEVELFA